MEKQIIFYDEKMEIIIQQSRTISKLESKVDQLKKELEDLKTGKRTRPPHLKVISINKADDSLHYNKL